MWASSCRQSIFRTPVVSPTHPVCASTREARLTSFHFEFVCTASSPASRRTGGPPKRHYYAANRRCRSLLGDRLFAMRSSQQSAYFNKVRISLQSAYFVTPADCPPSIRAASPEFSSGAIELPALPIPSSPIGMQIYSPPSPKTGGRGKETAAAVAAGGGEKANLKSGPL